MSSKEINHLEALKIKHRELDEQIKVGYSSYIADSNLSKLKQEKLYIKEKIVELEERIKENH